MRLPFIALTALTLTAAPAPTLAERLRLTASSQWNVDYGADKCTLQRKFGNGDDEIELLIEKSGLGPFYNLALVGKPLGKTVGDVMKIEFGPNAGASERSYLIGKATASRPPFIMLHGIHLAPAARTAVKGEFEINEISPESAETITSLALSKGLRNPVELEIGSMKEPLAAVRTCVDDLIQSLKLDAAGLSEVVKGPKPKNAKEFARFMQEQYPARLAMSGDSGTVSVQLTVNDKGRATTCQIAASDRPAVFDDAACFGLLKMAEFEPAIGADGKPRYSFWRTRVTFRTN